MSNIQPISHILNSCNITTQNPLSVNVNVVKGRTYATTSLISQLHMLHSKPYQNSVIERGITGIHSNISRLGQCEKL